ncbi:MAG: hypothetical protein WD207_04520 [Xanthobacteraceae bacterium]
MHRARLVALTFALSAISPAAAQEILTAEVAQKFVAGKLFSYSCFDGTEGSGKIFSDGSAIGTIRPMGRGDTRQMRLPAGTLFVREDRVCASLRGLPLEPCFNLTRISETSFRGSVSGLSFMYCEFERGGQTQLARRRAPRMELRGVLAGAGPGVP